MPDSIKESVWNLSLHSQTVESEVFVNDYNYRASGSGMKGEVNTQPNDVTTEGKSYLYGEHYKTLGDKEQVESGLWYATIRHQAKLSHQVIINGVSNCETLSVGQRVTLLDNPLPGMDEGIVILSLKSYGDRESAYEIHFTAIPYILLKPYRPLPLSWPKVSGTVTGRVSSPDNDTYGYIDTQGRYRVKLNFDLKEWKPGQESLWMRLAKPYAGETYGFHFPLIDGTEVAIAFTDGNPDRPYIAYSLHDSKHSDHVATANKSRNVIRTPANNKLRMEDRRGQEHIKLSTEYGKTQLNLGHLVNAEKQPRGEGFELRTDSWGAIHAAQGLYLTTETEPKAGGKTLDMQGAITQIENALSIAKALQEAALHAEATPSDTDSQEKLQAVLTNLTESGILAYANQGIALTSPENIQLSTGSSLTFTSEKNVDINSLEDTTINAKNHLSLFAHKEGAKLLANQGDVQIQAQNAALEIAAKENVQIDSTEGKTIVTAKDELILNCGGSYIKISKAGIELGTDLNITLKSIAMQKMGPASEEYTKDIPGAKNCQRTQQSQVQKQHALVSLD